MINSKKNSLLFVILLSIIPSIVYSQWQNEHIFGGNVKTIVANDSVIFASTYDSGVFISNNEGNTWNSFISSYTTFLAATDSSIFIVKDNILKVTNNYGKTWQVSILANTNNVIDLFSNDTAVFVQLSNNKIYFTPNTDANWVEVNEMPLLNIIEDNNTLIKITWQKGVFISYDQGNTWNLIKGTEWTQVNNSIVKCNNSVYIGTDKGVFSVNTIDTTLVQKSTNALITLFAYKGKLYECPWAKGINISSDNGTTWTASNEGLSNIHITSFAFNKNLYITSNEGVFKYDMNSKLWSNFTSGISGASYAPNVNNISFKDTNIYIGSESGIYNSSITNKIWNKMSDNFYKIYCINNTIYGLAGIEGIYSSIDNGQNWNEINTGLPVFFNEMYYYPNTTILFELNDSLFLGTNYGLFKSPKYNINWVETGLSNTEKIISFALSNGVIYIGTEENGIFSSSDMGTTWEQMNNGLSGLYIGSLSVREKYLFAGTDENIFYSNNYGKNWNILGGGFQDKQLTTSIYITDTIIYASTYFHGLWKLANPFKFSSISKEEISEFSIYPNPSSNYITFNLNIPSNIINSILKIFDENGQIISEIPLENRGEFKQTVNFKDLKYGVYFCQIEFDGKIIYNSKIIRKQ
jgi:photosystem II stability/assembly factor-like uncharacterized protein